MPSGKRARQQRQQATPPPVRSKGGTGGFGARQASPRTLAIAGGVVVLVIIAVVLGIVLGSKSSSGGTTDGSGDGPTIHIATGTPTVGSSSSPNALLGAAEVEKLFKNIPQHAFVLGNPHAPVTLIEYIDLQCPECQRFDTTELPDLVQKYVRPGKLKIEIQPWAILDRTADIHDSARGQKATIAAAAQDKAFNFAEVLYNNQGVEGTNWMNDAMISNIAASVDGLKPYQLATDANSAETKSVIDAITSFANSHPNQMTGTPTLYLGKGTGTPQYFTTGVPVLASLEAAIDALLK
jgi:protein-disulfide isomerase